MSDERDSAGRGAGDAGQRFLREQWEHRWRGVAWIALVTVLAELWCISQGDRFLSYTLPVAIPLAYAVFFFFAVWRPYKASRDQQ